MRSRHLIAVLGILTGIPLGYILKSYETVELPPRIESNQSIKQENELLKQLVRTMKYERNEINKVINEGQTK